MQNAERYSELLFDWSGLRDAKWPELCKAASSDTYLAVVPWVKGRFQRKISQVSTFMIQDTRVSKQNHLNLFPGLGEGAEGGSDKYICCLEFMKPAYSQRAPWSLFFF